jgi:uncharacterized protein YfaS (alpha-2-macroglobulin family)
MKKNVILLSVVAILIMVTAGAGVAYYHGVFDRFGAGAVKTVAPEGFVPVAAATVPAVTFTPLNLDPNWPQAKQAGKFWQELEEKRHTLKAQPPEVLAYLMKEVDDFSAVGNSAAIDKLRQALDMGADNAAAWIKYGDLSLRQGDDYTAAIAYLIASAHQPIAAEEAALYKGLAEVYQKQGQPGEEHLIMALQKSLHAQSNPALQQQLDELVGNKLIVTDIQNREDGDTPEACVTFSWALRDDGNVSYQDFITVKPAVKLAAIPSDKQLCLRGFTYGRSYELTLKAGLPARGKAKLSQDENRALSFSDRSPTLGFQNDTYILPRLNNLGVPLRGLNVDVAYVEIMQINDRNLVNQIIDGNVLNRSRLYSYSASQLKNDHGRSLWKGFLDLKKIQNKSVTTAIPFTDLVKDPVPGLYAIVAQKTIKKSERPDQEDDTSLHAINDKDYLVDYNDDYYVQWLVVTDIGLTTYDGQDGLHVAARSYSTGKPAAGVEVRLLSRDNTVLADSQTDAAGHIYFNDALLRGEGGKEAKLLQATGGAGDFTFIDLQQPALDLTDRGVDGRNAVKHLDAFLYSERGIYRPGDTLFLSALIRDPNATALETAPPVTLKIFRPDGVLFNQTVLNAHDVKIGGYHTSFDIPENARMGMWRADIFADPTEPAIGTYSWQVEDFVPARIEVKVAVPEKTALQENVKITVPVQADYLYGAPAAGSTGDATIDIRFADQTMFEQFKDYQFGSAFTDITSEQQALTMPDMDDKGQSAIDILLEKIPASSRPLEALVRASVFDDTGRAVNRTAIIPVTRSQAFLGIKELGGENQEDDDWNFSANRQFSVVAVDRSGNAVAQKGLRYRLVKEEYHYDWYASEGDRNYQEQVYDVPVKAGELTLTADKPAELGFSQLDYGTYRLDIFDPTQGEDRLTFASQKFNVGWMERAVTSKDKPDSLQLRLDKPSYRDGETAKLFIKAPFAGEIEFVLARETVLERQTLSLPPEGKTIEIPVSDKWGPGVYALVHAYRPGEKPVAGKESISPGRSVGVIWLGMDPKPRTLQIAMDVPEQITPAQTINVPVAVTGSVSAAEITLAAVDEGILQLTGFATPDPEGHFYAKRKLAVDLRDTYGRLLDPHVDALGRVRVGGDEAGRTGANLPSKWIKPVALFSGPVTLDQDGHATVPLQIPSFNGKLRLMAVAYNATQLGHAEKNLIVRDPVVVGLGLPRFLALGDKARLKLNLDNVDGPAGKVDIRFTTTGGVAISDYPTQTNLAAKKKAQLDLTLSAEKLGRADVTLNLTFANGKTYQQSWPLTVRAIQTYQNKVKTGVLKSDQDLTIDQKLLKDVVADDTIVTVALNTAPDMQLARLLADLDRYPYGCLEQTSSRLLPLLYLQDVVEQSGLPDKKAIPMEKRIQDAIAHLFSMQRSDGGFSLWNGYGAPEDFLSLYVIDVLQRAQAQGYNVPDYALKRALTWLRRQVTTTDFATPILHRRAYAYYLLAKAGLAEPSEIRYFAERYNDQFATRLSFAFTAAALTQIGDQDRAADLWSKALAWKEQKKSSADWYYYDYGSDVRDRLIVLTLMAEAKQDQEKTLTFADRLNADMAKAGYLSTQEEGWGILAVHALYENNKDMQVTLNGETVSVTSGRPLLKTWQSNTVLNGKQTITNTSDNPIYYSLIVNAVPKEIQPATENGFKIERTFFTRDGKPVDLKQVKVNDMMIAVIKGKVTDDRVIDQSLIVDLLPAGLELESARFGQGQDVADFEWIGPMSETAYQELRDDRFIAAFDPKSLINTDNMPSTESKSLAQGEFRFAYAVRAVTPGDYQLPAITVDSMYRPEFQARTTPDHLVIK